MIKGNTWFSVKDFYPGEDVCNIVVRLSTGDFRFLGDRSIQALKDKWIVERVKPVEGKLPPVSSMNEYVQRYEAEVTHWMTLGEPD